MKTDRLAGTCYDYDSNLYLAALRTDLPDITAAFYNGDFSLTLEQAQQAKHRWVLDGLGFAPGQTLLDVGCGWGPMLQAIREAVGHGIGLTLSRAQVDYCRGHGLDAEFADWKDADMSRYPVFDGIVSIGAFEHFCSREEYAAGQQERIHGDFFRFCHGCLKDGGKLFLQTMTWGYKVPTMSEVNPDAPVETRYHDRVRGVVLGMSSWWPPASEEQIVAAAAPYFTLISSNDGRQDYGQTFFEWHRRWESLSRWRRANLLLRQALTYWRDPDYRRTLRCTRAAILHRHFREAFLQKVLGHSRLFFARR
ncbi:MAG: class I SAM-dependent methyltransferase [Pirellulaceae bacterium]